MANEFMIAFNYEKAVKQADELLDIAKDIHKVATDKLEPSIKIVDKNWDGASSKKFVAKSRQLKDKVVDSANDIQAIADSIKEMAKKIYDAEMEAIRIAKEREAKLSS